MLNNYRGCYYCPYSDVCAAEVQDNYGLTLVGPESYNYCKIFGRTGSPDKVRAVLLDIEKRLPMLRNNEI